MGFISRKVLPACANMCVCCPALRSRSRKPVKRYKKLLSEIFPKSLDGPPNERKIVKLCEYAAKNPFRIPKIVEYLEQRIYKELRNEHFRFITIAMEAYNKLLCICKQQMAYFAVSLLNIVAEFLDNGKQDNLRLLGCQTLTRFIYSQADGSYAHNIESLVHNICLLAREGGTGEEHNKRCLRASSLQCISAMVWFMSEFSHIFADFDEIVHVTLENYEPNRHLLDDDEIGEPHHNWVDEVVRSETRVGAGDVSPSYMITRPRPEKKDVSLLTREEIETPKVWAQICIQKMADLAKEATTVRQILDPMFIYFDIGRHWVPRQGLASVILSDISYFLESSENKQQLLSAIIRHLDHKNVAHDPHVKSDIIGITAVLARQLISGGVVAETGIVSDLCRHLRKSLQATVELAGEQEVNLNILLQNSIEDCLLEIAKGMGDAKPLFDMMAISLDKLPPVGVVARATIGSMLILAHIISMASTPSHPQEVFPEVLLVQLLKTMMHPDTEVRIGAHQIFSVLLIPSRNHPKHELASFRSGYLYEPKRWQSKSTSAFASANALLEKLRREKDGEKVDKHGKDAQHHSCDKEVREEECRQGRVHQNLPNLYKISSIIDRTAGSAVSGDTEPNVIKLSEDQVAQLLSAFWIQANLSDNTPSNFEAISHSFNSTLISSRLRNQTHNVVRFFQLPLSLRSISLDPHNGTLPASCQRSLFVLATAMLMSTAKIYHIPDLYDYLKSLVPYDIDPYLSIGDHQQIYLKSQLDPREYQSAVDQQAALYSLSELREAVHESDKAIQEIIVRSLTSTTELDADDLSKQLSEPFSPDDTMLFGPQSWNDGDHHHAVAHSMESLSFDGDFLTTVVNEDDAVSESSVADLSRFIPKVSTSPSLSHIISVGKLLESAIEVAGQVAGASISTSPLPYSAMASQCEALGKCTKKKLSNWLSSHDSLDSKSVDGVLLNVPADGRSMIRKISSDIGPRQEGLTSTEPWLALRLPPASPFDNFLKAAKCADIEKKGRLDVEKLLVGLVTVGNLFGCKSSGSMVQIRTACCDIWRASERVHKISNGRDFRKSCNKESCEKGNEEDDEVLRTPWCCSWQ